MGWGPYDFFCVFFFWDFRNFWDTWFTRWWGFSQIFGFFDASQNRGSDPIWRGYFSNGWLDRTTNYNLRKSLFRRFFFAKHWLWFVWAIGKDLVVVVKISVNCSVLSIRSLWLAWSAYQNQGRTSGHISHSNGPGCYLRGMPYDSSGWEKTPAAKKKIKRLNLPQSWCKIGMLRSIVLDSISSGQFKVLCWNLLKLKSWRLAVFLGPSGDLRVCSKSWASEKGSIPQKWDPTSDG